MEKKLNYMEVRSEYLNMMNSEIALKSEGTKCSSNMVWDVIGLASINCKSIHSSCKSLKDAPTGEAILCHLRKSYLNDKDLFSLERDLNELLPKNFPPRIQGRSHTVAADLTFIPYHGNALKDPNEVRRSKAKSGTTHFHAYASAYVVYKNKRVTLAVAYWQADETLLEVLQRLLIKLAILDVGIKRLLLDRQFATVEIISYLKDREWQSIMPIPARSKQLKDLRRTAFRSLKLSYTMESTEQSVTFELHVVCRYLRGRRGKKGKERYLFAVIGQPWRSDPAGLAETYRSRFGIESSYRMMNRVRARTSSPDPKLRLLFVFVAFSLLNLWVNIQWHIFSIPRRGGRFLDHSIFRLDLFCNFLRNAVGDVYHFIREITVLISDST